MDSRGSPVGWVGRLEVWYIVPVGFGRLGSQLVSKDSCGPTPVTADGSVRLGRR